MWLWFFGLGSVLLIGVVLMLLAAVGAAANHGGFGDDA